MTSSKFQWLMVGASCASAVALAFLVVPPFAGLLFVRHWGYFVILAAFLAFCGSLLQTLRADRGWNWRGLDTRMVVAAAITAIAWQFQEPHGFKILMDELVLNATAMSMHFDREVFVPLKTHHIDGLNFVLGGIVDKRPLLFPFLLSLLHDLIGYRPENVFIFNALLAFALLTAVGHFGRLISNSRPAGIFSVLLLAGLPLLSLNATGGGFDVLNLVLIVLVALFAVRYLDQPDAVRQNNLVLATVLLAQCRYESAMYVGAAAVFLLAGWYATRSLIFSWGLIGAPLFLINIPLQNKLFTINPGYWQPERAEAPFSPEFFSDNLGHAVNFLFSVDSFNTASLVLSVVGLACTPIALLYMFRRWRQTLQSPPLLSFGVIASTILINVCLLFCYFWGQLDDYVAARLALPLLTLFSLSCAFVFGRWIKTTAGWTIAYTVAAIWIWGWSIPVSTNARSTQSFLAYQEVAREREFIKDAPRSSLFVLNSPLPAIVQRRAAIPIAVLAERARELDFHLTAGTYDSVYLFQRMVYDAETGEFRPFEGNDLGPEFLVEPIETRRLKSNYALKLSRITGVDLARALPKPPDWKPRFPPFPIGPVDDETPVDEFIREYLEKLP